MLNFEPPSAIITDSRMPNGGGKRIVRVAGKLIPVLILSGSDTTQAQLDYQRLGAHAYFAKPCPIERIIEWVSAVSSEHESEIVVQHSGGGSASESS